MRPELKAEPNTVPQSRPIGLSYYRSLVHSFNTQEDGRLYRVNPAEDASWDRRHF